MKDHQVWPELRLLFCWESTFNLPSCLFFLIALQNAAVRMVDIHAALLDKGLFPDFVHPGAEGATRIAQAVSAAVSVHVTLPAVVSDNLSDTPGGR